jgi:ketosteroid isomerase-like protein
MPEGMPMGCGHFEGLQDVLDRFLTNFYKALDVHFVAEEFIAAGEEVVALGRIEGKTRKAAVPVNVPFAHVWTVRDGYLQRLRAFTDTAVLARALAKN